MTSRSYHRDQQLQRIERDMDAIRKAALDRGFVLVVRGDGTHWDFRRQGKFVDWWPGSGKVAVDKAFDGMKRADSVAEIVAILEAHKAPVAPELLPAGASIRPGVERELSRHDFATLAATYRRNGWQTRGYPSAGELRDCARSMLTGVTPHGPVVSARMRAEVVGGVPVLSIPGVSP